MAQQSSSSGSGCATLLILVAVLLLLAFWQVVVVLAVVAGAIGLVIAVLLQHQHQRMRQLVQAAERRVRNDPCQLRDRFGVVEAITLGADLTPLRIEIRCRTIHASNVDGSSSLLSGEPESISLSPPSDPQQLRGGSGTARWLAAGGITLLDELSVEAKDVKAAMECLRERQWTAQSIAQLEQLRRSLIDTLAKAEGNELLEPSIPQLQEALAAFGEEGRKLQQAHEQAEVMLRKLHDFLSVPSAIRPILTFDLDRLFDPHRRAELEQSFAEVVALNDAFRQLSRDALI